MKALNTSRAYVYGNIIVQAYHKGVSPERIRNFLLRRAGKLEGLRNHTLETIEFVESHSDLRFDRTGIMASEKENTSQYSMLESKLAILDWPSQTHKESHLIRNLEPLINVTRDKAIGGTARMLSLQAALVLAEICIECRPRIVVDLGTYTGLSALTMALSTPRHTKVLTCDNDGDSVELGRSYWGEESISKKIDSRILDGLEFLKNITTELGVQSVDLLLLDANFEKYFEYFSLISTIMKPGGLFLIDSPNWWGLKEELC